MGLLWGRCMAAFIVGVAVHTAARRFSVPPFVWGVLLAACVTALSFVSVRKIRIAVFILLAFCLGVWRVDISGPPRLRNIDGKFFLMKNRADTVWSGYRAAVTARISSSFSKEEVALVAGVLYGDAAFSKQAKERFVATGLMHIVAVSGSNVTILIHAVSVALFFFGFRRRLACAVSGGALLAFTLFVGAEPSVLRAAIMAAAVLAARECGRPTSPFRLLLFAATLLLAWNPWQLLYDASFILSFLAMWGVLAWTPYFSKHLSFVTERWGLNEIAAMSCAATLMTAPYLAWAFGRMTLLGLATNLVVLPMIPFIMAGGFVSALLGPSPFAPIVSVPTQGFVWLVYEVSRLGEIAPWFDVFVRGMSVGGCIATYALILFLWKKSASETEPADDGCGFLGACFGRVSVR